MDEKSKAALDLLVQNGYLEIVKGKYRPTVKLNEPVVKSLVNVLNQVAVESWEDMYVKFIRECNIPKQGETGEGDNYALNKYSVDAMKAFRKMIERDGIKYDILVIVTQAYYKAGTIRYKKTISNFIMEGIWRMDYEIMKTQTTEQQQQTIQQQLNESKPFTRDRIG